VFDQNSQPQWFSLDSVISGWRSALQQMPVGAKWRLVIPSAQAYGADGAGDLIAPLHRWCSSRIARRHWLNGGNNGAQGAPFQYCEE
jgi:hypothetical protein